jgi:arsenical pump membrane protein
MRRHAWIVVLVLAVVLMAYPITAYFDGPLWVVAASGAAVCVAAARAAGVGLTRIAGGVSWSILPFLVGVLLVALALQEAGAVARLAWLFDESPAPLPTIGAVAAVGSAVLNNHPMSLLDGFALDQIGGSDIHVLAALVGGDLGPRLLPVGSLAGLLWLDVLRRHQIDVKIGSFVRIGVVLTILPMAVAITMLWLLA